MVIQSCVCTVLLLLLTAAVVKAQNTCPNFGSSDQQGGSYTTQRTSRLILNFGNTAQCNGTVTAWTYCFHGPTETPNNDTRYSAVFIVYRRTTGNVYNAVPNSMHTVRLSLQEQAFDCRRWNLTDTEQFLTQENDVIGACLFESDPLNMVSVNNEANTHVYQSESESYMDCNISAIGGIDTAEDFDIKVTYILHLQAHIRASEFSECTIGDNAQHTSVFRMDNLILINTQHPSLCNGEVTAWKLCYYTSIDRGTKNFSTTVGVWRRVIADSGYTTVEGSLQEITLELQRNNEPEPALICITEPAVPFHIERLDLVGVVIPHNRPLPIVGIGSSGTQLLDLSSNQTVSNLSLHLYAVVNSGSGSPSAALPVVLVLLAAIAITACLVVLILCYWQKQRRNLVLRGVSVPSKGMVRKKGSVISTHYRPPKHSGTATIQREQEQMNQKKPMHYKPKRQSSSEEQQNVLVTSKATRQSNKKPSGEASKREGTTQLLNEPPKPTAKSSPRPLRSPSFKKALKLPAEQTSSAEQGSRYEMSSEYKFQKQRGSYTYAETDYSLLEQQGGVYSYAEGDYSEADYSALLEQNITEDIYGSVDHYKNPASDKDALYGQLRGWGISHIKRGTIKMLSHLGSGQFGSVELGEWEDGYRKVSVALKTLNKGSSLQDIVKFLQEAAIMAQFNHPNVINLHGVVVTGEPIVLVVELADGDLLEHLEHIQESLADGKYPNVSELLLNYSLQVGLGMQYLSAKGFVHRDLAARNILVKNGRTCKIADFGMSRDLADEKIYVSSGGKIPFKWTAPEAVQYGKYSTASDVWSYGCVLFEIWSLGAKPFGSEKNSDVMKLLKSGFRLPPPPGCPRVVYEAMIHTWNPDADQRSKFRDTVLKLVGNKRSDRSRVLQIPEGDSNTHTDAARIGAELEAGMLMYRDLQERYRQK